MVTTRVSYYTAIDTYNHAVITMMWSIAFTITPKALITGIPPMMPYCFQNRLVVHLVILAAFK